MNKGELMKLVYSGRELSNGIDTAIPKEYWDGNNKEIQVDDTYYFVYNYNEPNRHGVLEDMRVVAKERGIDIEKGLDKITELARQFGYDYKRPLIEDNYCSSTVPGICMNDDCNYTTDVEPDCSTGYCEICHNKTVKSALVIEGLI